MRIRLPVSGCLLLSAICLASIASAQTVWTRTYGGPGDDEAFSAQQTADGGFILAGSTSSFGAGGTDVYLIKTNAEGDTLWTRTYGGPKGDGGRAVQQTTDGGYIISGFTGFRPDTEPSSYVYLIKTDASGDTLWTRTYGYSEGTSVQQTADGGYIVAGPTTDNVWSSAYLMKTNASGDRVWRRTYSGGLSWCQGKCVQQTTDGGYVIACSNEFNLIKTDAQGDTLWTRLWGVFGYQSVQQTRDGGYVIAGEYPFLLTKVNAQGDTLWTRSWRDFYSAGNSAQQTTDGGYIAAGFFGWPGDICLMKTDTSGDTLWTRTYGGAAGDEGYSVQQTTDGCYIIAGTTSSFGAGGDDVYLIKTNGLLDVGPVAILSLPDTVDFGSLYVPRVVVRNYGLTSGIMAVALDIGSSYSQTVQETLVSVPLDTVVFPAWTAAPAGSLPVKCFTSLVGDQNPANDTIRDSVLVGPPPPQDVGATVIISPSSTVRAGDTVIPRARIRNFGNRQERYFDVRFRIGASYNEKVNVTVALPPDSTAELAFPPWVAEAGNWAVSCSTMLASDIDRANDRANSSVEVYVQSLAIEPDQSDRVEAGKSKPYSFYALIRGETGAIVEVARPSPPPGWSARLLEATGTQDLTDTDGDGIPDLGYVAPGESGRFSLDVTAPSELRGDTASLSRVTVLVAGHVGDRPDIADTAVLTLTLVPELSVHNFPNPFSDQTSFVIGLPEDGKASLTVYTRDGARVCRVLTNADLPAGVHLVPWDGVNDNGRSIAPGTYEYLLDYVHAGKTDRIHKKLVLTRQ